MSSEERRLSTRALVDKLSPNVEVPEYSKEQRAAWPAPLRGAYVEWARFRAELQADVCLLNENRREHEDEIWALDRALSFLDAPHEENNLTIEDPDENELIFPALGPYGDPNRIRELYEDCLTARYTSKNYWPLVHEYMKFLARYDPQYWEEDENDEILDNGETLQRNIGNTTDDIDEVGAIIQNLTERLDHMEESAMDGGGLNAHERRQSQAMQFELESHQNFRNRLQDALREYEGKYMMQRQIDEWVEANKEPRGSNMGERNRDGTVYFEGPGE